MRALYTVKQKLNSDCSTGQLVTGGMLLHYEELKRPDGALRLDRAGGASEEGGFQLVRAGVVMEEDDPGLSRLGDAATGALVQLVGVSVVLAFFLSMTSGNPLLNLPLALLVVWGVRFLAQVRVTVRWDANSRRFNLILTRQRKEGVAGALTSRGKCSVRSDTSPAIGSMAPSASE